MVAAHGAAAQNGSTQWRKPKGCGDTLTVVVAHGAPVGDGGPQWHLAHEVEGRGVWGDGEPH